MIKDGDTGTGVAQDLADFIDLAATGEQGGVRSRTFALYYRLHRHPGAFG